MERNQKNPENPQKKSNEKGSAMVDAATILSIAKRRGFLWPAFEIYGGIAGFYDYGPLGTLLKENIKTYWRRYFVFGERCAEIDTPDIAPEEVFIASGHVDEFKDFMVQCKKCKSAFRADHLLQHLGINADNLKIDELKKVLIDNINPSPNHLAVEDSFSSKSIKRHDLTTSSSFQCMKIRRLKRSLQRTFCSDDIYTSSWK